MSKNEKAHVKPDPMHHEDFIDWMQAMNLNQSEAARIMGVTPATVFNWINNGRPLPRYVGLACSAAFLGVDPYPNHAAVLRRSALIPLSHLTGPMDDRKASDEGDQEPFDPLAEDELPPEIPETGFARSEWSR